MTKKDLFTRDLLAGIDDIGEKVLPEKSGTGLKDCLKNSLDLITTQDAEEFDFEFLEHLEQQVVEELLGCGEMGDLSAEKRAAVKEDLAAIFRALDFKYSGPPPEAAMRGAPEEFEDAEGIEPWWDDEEGS